MTVLISRATDQSNFNFEIGATLNYIEIANLFVLNIKKTNVIEDLDKSNELSTVCIQFSHGFIFF